MPLGTIDRTPPPFFKQGPSALSKLVVFSAVALFLMVADLRFKVTDPLRAVLATALYPVQWAVLQPVHAITGASGYFASLHHAQQSELDALRRLTEQAVRSSQVEQLEILDFLRAHRPFDELPEEVLQRTAATIDVRYYKAGESIVEFGQVAEFWHVVRSGAVEVFRRPVP